MSFSSNAYRSLRCVRHSPLPTRHGRSPHPPKTYIRGLPSRPAAHVSAQSVAVCELRSPIVAPFTLTACHDSRRVENSCVVLSDFPVM